MDEADIQKILELADNILNVIFSQKIISRRSLLISSIISVSVITPSFSSCLFAFWRTDYGGAVAANSLNFSIPLVFINILFDFASLVATRLLIRWLRCVSRFPLLSLGIVADISLVIICMAGTISSSAYSNTP